MKYLVINSRLGWGIGDTPKAALSVAAKHSVKSPRDVAKRTEEPWIVGEDTHSIYELDISESAPHHVFKDNNWRVFLDDMGYIHHPETVSLRKVKYAHKFESISDIWMDAIDEAFDRITRLVDMASSKKKHPSLTATEGKVWDADFRWERLKEVVEGIVEEKLKNTQEVES
jgi:hypothetical protein